MKASHDGARCAGGRAFVSQTERRNPIMTATDKNKPTRKERLRLISAGVAKHYANTSLMLNGVTYPASSLEQAIQKDIAATDAADQARATWSSLVQAERDSHVALAPVLRALKSQVIANHGDAKDASAILADFGYTPRKVTKKKVATKATAVALVQATRKARNILGKNQKKKVKGTVSATTPTAAPATTASSPTPAPSPTAPAPVASKVP
jgi:hypothetical protein